MAPKIVLITGTNQVWHLFVNLLIETAGANSGVGFATTKVLANSPTGFHIIMAGRSPDKVKTAMAEINQPGIKGSVSAIQLDVTDETSIKQAAHHVEQEYGHLDALINNAGVGNMDPDLKTRMHICMETNFIGPSLVAEAFRPLLLKSGNAYSIYISSDQGSLSIASDPTPSKFPRMPNEEAYRASKAALNMLAVLEAKQFGELGLKVFAMHPGFVVSNLRGT
ncbi:MAG: hypothetical protein Q9170_004997, partial [Blastenia crenularia]